MWSACGNFVNIAAWDANLLYDYHEVMIDFLHGRSSCGQHDFFYVVEQVVIKTPLLNIPF
jgi:hypothetical protein